MPPQGWPAVTEPLLLTRRDVAELLSLEECIAAVERAFRLHAQGKALRPATLSVYANGGGFHVKAAGLALERAYFAAKTNGNFPGNEGRFGLPTIQGVIVLCDATNGSPLAIMDSIEVTILRTGAATALAAKHLARADSTIVTVCGCGNQGRVQLRALATMLPFVRAYAFDEDRVRARRFAAEMAAELSFEVIPIDELRSAVRDSDVCVTCTPAREPVLHQEVVPPGMFVAAVGSDSPDKNEIDAQLLARSTVVVDVLDQCAEIGDLHHALRAGIMTAADVHAELADLVVGAKPGRTSREEITVFDSTGTALQDVAAAATVYENAIARGRGVRWNLAA
jgi:alanine dehydrogenase